MTCLLNYIYITSNIEIYITLNFTQFSTIGTIGTIVQASLDSPDSTIVPIVLCNTVYYAVLLMMSD